MDESNVYPISGGLRPRKSRNAHVALFFDRLEFEGLRYRNRRQTATSIIFEVRQWATVAAATEIAFELNWPATRYSAAPGSWIKFELLGTPS